MRRVILTILVIPLMIDCSGTETVEPVNQPPTIRFTFDEIAVDFTKNALLTVEVSDPNGDPLTVNWAITPGAGTLVAQNSQKTAMEWAPTRSPGTDTVTVTVSDGQVTRSVTEVLKRATKMRGTDYSGAVFLKASSPYLLDPRDDPSQDPPPVIFIPGGYTVSIEAGVEMYLAAFGQEIEVLGTFVANGTEQDPVVIWPNDRSLRCGERRGWWKYIQVSTEDQFVGQVNFSYTTIAYAEENLWVRAGSAGANLQHCELRCSRNAGVKMSSNGSLTVNGCEITSNRQYGIEISSLASLPSSVVVTGSNVSSNGHTGIYMDLFDTFQEVPITIQNNNISFNTINGILMVNSVWATIQNNDIVFNNLSTLSNIRLNHTDNGFPAAVSDPEAWDTLLAINNYWGSVIPPENIGLIESSVWDSTDYPSAVDTRIIVSPWQNTSQYTP